MVAPGVLSLHLIIGYVLGWMFVARDARLTFIAGLGGLAALGWGALTAVTTGGDSDRIAVLAGGFLIAAANVIVGAILGAAVTARMWSSR